MAIVNLGNFDLNIGDAPAEYTPFAFRDNRAYLLKGTITVENPNSVFSQLLIRGRFTNPNNSNVFTHHVIYKPIIPGQFVFLYPFSNLYDGNGTTNVIIERLPLVIAGSDGAGVVNVDLEYDDQADIRSWL